MSTNVVRDVTCASHLQFDRWLAGELEPARAAELARHVHSCARCEATFAAICRGARAFSPSLPSAIVSRLGPTRRAEPEARWWHWSLPLLAASAVALAWIGSGQPTTDSPARHERTKGAAQARFYVMHDGVVRPGVGRERVNAGDAIEFVYSSDRDLYLAILSIDAARQASVYYDANGQAAKIVAARDRALDRSTVLDATLGAETIYALFCEDPIAIAPLTRALEAAPGQPPAAEGCTIERHELVKVGR